MFVWVVFGLLCGLFVVGGFFLAFGLQPVLQLHLNSNKVTCAEPAHTAPRLVQKTRWSPRTRMQTRSKSYICPNDTLVGHSCGTLLRVTLVGNSCGTLLWDTPVGHSCGILLWGTLVGHSCRTLLWDTLVGHSCGTLLQDTLVGHS